MVLYVSARRNSEIGKIIDKKWFIRIELLVRLTSRLERVEILVG